MRPALLLLLAAPAALADRAGDAAALSSITAELMAVESAFSARPGWASFEAGFHAAEAAFARTQTAAPALRTLAAQLGADALGTALQTADPTLLLPFQAAFFRTAAPAFAAAQTWLTGADRASILAAGTRIEAIASAAARSEERL